MKKTVQLFFKILIIGIVITCVIAGWAWGLEFLQGRKFIINNTFAKEFLSYLLYGVVLTTINILFFKYFDEDIDWENSKYRKYRIPLGLVIGLVLTLIGVFLIRFVT